MRGIFPFFLRAPPDSPTFFEEETTTTTMQFGEEEHFFTAMHPSTFTFTFFTFYTHFRESKIGFKHNKVFPSTTMENTEEQPEEKGKKKQQIESPTNLPLASLFAPEMMMSFSFSSSTNHSSLAGGKSDELREQQQQRKRRRRHEDEEESVLMAEATTAAAAFYGRGVGNWMRMSRLGPRAEEEAADSPPAAHHPRHPCPLPPPHPLFIAWPPVPVLHRPTAIPQPEYHTSRRRSHSTATRSTTQATATSPSSTSASSSPFRHIQSTLRSARRSILHKGSTREYTRVPEEEGEEEWDHQQAGTSAAQSAIAAQHTASARQTKASRNQQRIRRLQQYTSSRPVSAAFPKNYGSSEGGQKMAPYKLDVVLQMPPLGQEEAEKHGWDPDDRSINIYVKEEDKLTLHRHPVAQSTDCIRGKIGFKRGFHVWQITWPSNQRGTHAVIGVATKSCPLQVAGYTSLVGLDTEGFGWDIVENKCYHNSKSTKGWTYPPEKLQHLFEQSTTIAAAFRAPEKLFCILDMDEGQLSFATESKYLGVAFAGLKGKHLYPAVSAVWGHCEVTMRYLGGLDPEPKRLMEICRQRIRVEMGTSRLHRVNELNIPPSLRQFLLYN